MMNVFKLPKSLLFIPGSIFTGLLFIGFLIFFDYDPDAGMPLLFPNALILFGIVLVLHMVINYLFYRLFLKKTDSIPAFIVSSLLSFTILFTLIITIAFIDSAYFN
ncbi:MAG: hypothetical protein JEZ03_06590 [Bacteroidales bacterium]|nr:hypothetical protein [Bacteroidales bacterium]